MKPKLAFLIITAAFIMSMALAENPAYAESVSRTIHLTVTVIGNLSLDIDENALSVNSRKPEAEAFSDFKSHNIEVSKVKRNKTELWLFTKTE